MESDEKQSQKKTGSMNMQKVSTQSRQCLYWGQKDKREGIEADDCATIYNSL